MAKTETTVFKVIETQYDSSLGMGRRHETYTAVIYVPYPTTITSREGRKAALQSTQGEFKADVKGYGFLAFVMEHTEENEGQYYLVKYDMKQNFLSNLLSSDVIREVVRAANKMVEDHFKVIADHHKLSELAKKVFPEVPK